VRGAEQATHLALAVAENATGRLVGAIGLHGLASPDRVEIGYWLAAPEWGNGYAAEACATLARFALASGARRVQVVCDVANAASAAVALRAGFAFEGIARAEVTSASGVADGAIFARTAADADSPVRPWLPALAGLDDGVVGLRPAGPRDAAIFFAELTNAESQRFALAGRSTVTIQQCEQHARAAALRWLIGPAAALIITDAATGTPAGTMTLRRSGPPNVAGIGYGILPEFRGRGYTSRALSLLADWVFAQTSIHRLELGCKPDNLASARAADRAGFAREGLLRGRLADTGGGTFSDELKFSRLRSDA
jgi:RimJ/RimL family protein N-acetyltransferase